MSQYRMSRRHFLRMSALGSSALLLAACGRTAVQPTQPPPPATALPPTATPTPFTPTPAPAAGTIEEKVLVGDVLDYTLTSDEWPGAFGFVTFRLHKALYNGEPVYYIRTDASDAAFAEENGLVHVPLLNVANGQDVANTLYVFDDDRDPVIVAAPDDEAYSPLFQIHQVTVEDASVTLNSADAMEQAANDGTVAIEPQSIFVNYPLIQWPGGSLTVDEEKQEYLGGGQLLEPVDTENMQVTMKLHACFPGTRYMVTDTSAAPMAPMMSVPASSPTQALMDLGGVDEIWVFGNGIGGSGVMGFQPGIFDNQAGEPGWSPFWNHFTLTWNDENNARILRSAAEIRAALDVGEIEQFNGTPDSHPNGFVVNCPVPIVAPLDV